MNISYTMFNNYHSAAKEFSNGDMTVYGRLMYIVNTYAIEGVIVDDLSPVEKLFLTSIKASIDKSIRLSEAGRKGGKHCTASEEIPEECTEMDTDTSLIDSNNEAYKPLEMACNEIEEEEELLKRTNKFKKETEQKGNAPDLSDSPSVLFGSDLTKTQKEVLDWITVKNLSLRGKNKHYLLDISDFLDKKHYDTGFLNYVLEIVISEYPKVNLGILYHAFFWENTVCGYETIKKHKTKFIKAKAPGKCSVCGAQLVERLPNMVECPDCRKQGNPIWWELNTQTNVWECSA